MITPFVIYGASILKIANLVKAMKGFEAVRTTFDIDTFKGNEYIKGDLIIPYNSYLAGEYYIQETGGDKSEFVNPEKLYIIIRKTISCMTIGATKLPPTPSNYELTVDGEIFKVQNYEEYKLFKLKIKGIPEEIVYVIRGGRVYMKPVKIYEDGIQISIRGGVGVHTLQRKQGRFFTFYGKLIESLKDSDEVIFVYNNMLIKLRADELNRNLTPVDSFSEKKLHLEKYIAVSQALALNKAIQEV